ncbi:MAG TPA: class I SAM-dependent methyltransferase, partial [Gammaproteobacteria bacterium]|nr:class I SAM-dependent methyltransferase [Gammaproteobacteria bacterium]
MSRKNKHQKNQKGKGTTLANQADRYVLYEKAVQCVEAEIDMVDETFQSLRSRTARILREDFCGTANTSCEWVQRRDDNQAYAVDLDKKVIRWGEKHNIAKLNDDAASRIHLLNDDVLTVDVPPADMVLAMNFSYQIFKTRSQLRNYFGQVYTALVGDGVFFLDAFGGYETYREMEEETEHDDFTYVWDQARYQPVTGNILCYIHFTFPDGSKINRAFAYDWRLWTLPELQELLTEAGFARTQVYWEGTERKSGEGDGVYT